MAARCALRATWTVSLEFGTPTSAPIPGGAPALAKESPQFEKTIGDVAERWLSDE